MTNILKNYAGVDVSKNKLDIHIHPVEEFFTIDNTKAAIKRLIVKLKKYDLAQIACEATGGYEKLLAQLLGEHFDVWVVDPRRIKGFIISTGCKTKTDKIDSKKIAEFAAKNTKEYETYSKTEKQENLLSLVNRKGDLVVSLATEKTRLKHPAHSLSSKNIKKHIVFLEKEIKVIESQIKNLVDRDEKLSKKSEILESISGIGKATASVLLSFVPELGSITNKQASALIGVCPYDNSSGKYKGKKFIRGGRGAPRKSLYMCALTAIKYSPILKNFYERLIAKQKPFKVAIVAVMHKLVILANSLLKKGELCRP